MNKHETENQLVEHSTIVSMSTKLCMIEKCSECNDEVELVSGAVIYGDKWFHNSCWKIRSNRNVR